MQKDELMGQMEFLKEQLEQQKQEHQTVIYNLEKKAVLDNYRSVWWWINSLTAQCFFLKCKNNPPIKPIQLVFSKQFPIYRRFWRFEP